LILDIVGSEHNVAAGKSCSNVESDDGPLLGINSSDPSGLDGLKQVVEEIADKVWRCNRCLSFKHDTIDCSNQIRCRKCYKYGHIRRNCFGSINQNRVWVVKNKQLASDTTGSESFSKGAVSSSPKINLSDTKPSSPLSPLPPPLPTHLLPMTNFELNPARWVPEGFQIIDGGPTRLPCTFYTPAVAPQRSHDTYCVAIVEPPQLPDLE
jgi:hypothetical protein